MNDVVGYNEEFWIHSKGGPAMKEISFLSLNIKKKYFHLPPVLKQLWHSVEIHKNSNQNTKIISDYTAEYR